MKKVSTKKYFDDNAYCYEDASHSIEYPSKHEAIIHGLKEEILCHCTEKCWEDENSLFINVALLD